MSVEIEVHCPRRPDPEALARMAAFAMRTILGVPDGEIRFEERERSWRFHWGEGAHVATFFAPPTEFEVNGAWYLSFMPSARGMAVPYLLMIVVSASAALLTGGTLDDDNFPFSRTDLDPEILLAQVLREAPLPAEAAVHLLRTGQPAPA
ncbi:hypothetical protein HCN51_21120 [Nonomuraea sp. FMUSA5-5]|uniref:Uncharacterized protein n=1 Tax=Nonomuraea composti TaxID=2720023 RepID=A0ABX1B3I4_9ACTN|nr:hypothetical protein [Nonomuraea sp. FMUSA5-5]NJP91931.1 hypothetical protein [Nonomuraea sp. FMUSA5-5]